MKEIDLAALFCEVLSGLAAGVVVLAYCDWAHPAATAGTVAWVLTRWSVMALTVVLLGAFLIGLVVDAFGLLFDELVVDRIKWFRAPAHEDAKKFWPVVSEHVLRYRNEQWTYYSSYRNLLMLLIVGLVPGIRAGAHYGGWWGAALGFVTAIALLAALACSMRVTLRVYNSVRRAFD